MYAIKGASSKLHSSSSSSSLSSSSSSSNSSSSSSSAAQSHRQAWRLRERLRTVGVALCVCLNIGVDPPNVVKPRPCAKLEAWIDTDAQPPAKALKAVGKALQSQFEQWQPRASYRQLLDPTIDDVRKLCSALRRSAGRERAMFYYNGHGVPRPTQPTTNGEIWVSATPP